MQIFLSLPGQVLAAHLQNCLEENRKTGLNGVDRIKYEVLFIFFLNPMLQYDIAVMIPLQRQ